MSIAIGVLTFLLILVSLFLIMVVLAQKAKSDGGVGAAMGGGMAEAAFGADTGNVLSRSTIYAAVAFFVLSFVLFLAHVRRAAAPTGGAALPAIAAPAAPALPPAGATPGSLTPSPAVPAALTPAPAAGPAAPAAGAAQSGAPAAPAPAPAPKAP